jgi:hypothetical protein
MDAFAKKRSVDKSPLAASHGHLRAVAAPLTDWPKRGFGFTLPI